MPFEKLYQTQTDVGTWSADSTQRVEIDNIGRITELMLTVETTPSATFDGANQPDGLFRMMRSVKVQGGSHTYFDTPDDDGGQGGVLLRYLNLNDGMGVGHGAGDVAAPSQSFVPMTWWLHCGVLPQKGPGRPNPFDLSGFIPQVGSQTVNLEWTVSGNDVLDDTITVSSATLRVTRAFIVGDEPDIRREMMAQMQKYGLHMPPGAIGMIPAWSTSVDSPTAAASDFGRELNIPTDSSYLRRIAVLTQDDTATRTLRAEDLISEVKVSIHGQDYYKAKIDQFAARLPYGSAMEADENADDFGAHYPHGVYLLPMEIFGETGFPAETYGINLRNVVSSAAKLAYTVTSNVASGDDVLVLFERYKALFPR